MLKQRIVTAIVLLSVLALAVSSSSAWPFLIFLSLACACAGFEWLRLTLGGRSVWSFVGGLLLFVAALLQASQWISGEIKLNVTVKNLVLSAVLIWVLVMLPTLWRSQVTKPMHAFTNSLAALVTLYATWVVLAYWYVKRGPSFVVTLLIVVWVADIAAYFVGRAFGRHKLAPSISPGKTIEGALAGVAGVVAWLIASAGFSNTFASVLLTNWSWLGLVVAAIFLAVFSITGDLYESLLKRRAGVKDSSQLLPGHGGVYDRIDAVVAVVPLAFVLIEGYSW